MLIRSATRADDDAIWRVLEPTIRAGETYALDRDMRREDALAYWFAPGNAVFAAELDGEIVGMSYVRANQAGGGSHVYNASFMTAQAASGRGVARALCLHAMAHARAHGFRAMQFNFVVSSNTRAVALWTSLGFARVGRIPGAFDHPGLGLVDALVMHRTLDDPAT